jgi:hypothetical protein
VTVGYNDQPTPTLSRMTEDVSQAPVGCQSSCHYLGLTCRGQQRGAREDRYPLIANGKSDWNSKA